MAFKKKIFIPILVVVICFIASFIYFTFKIQPISEKVQKELLLEEKVLAFLEQKLKFCEIIKSDFVHDKGEFWLICNERPFYAVYDNGRVNYNLNGWGFLKNTEYWSELENCDFYDSKKIDENYQLTFYCPRDFDARQLKAKIFEFDPNLLKVKKIEEKDFLEIVNEGIVNIYPFLEDCEIEAFKTVPEWDPPTLSLTYSCKEEEK